MALQATLIEVDSQNTASDLASRVRNPQRRVPLVVIALPGPLGTASGVLDVEELRSSVGIRADVATVPRQWVDAFNGRLPSTLAVFGDAARVYPVSRTWDSKPPHCEIVAGRGDPAWGLWRVRDVVDALNPLRRRAQPQANITPLGGAVSDLRNAQARLRQPAGSPSTGIQHVTSELEADELAELLLSPSRTAPVVVVTVPAGERNPWIDVETLSRETVGLAWVFQVPTGRLTLRLTSAIGALQGVYGGAGRVYPADRAWLVDPYTSALRTVYDAQQGRQATDELIGDVLAQSYSADATSLRLPATPQDTVATHAEVASLVPPTRALVRLPDGRVGAIWADAVPGASDIHYLVEPGQQVTGSYDAATGRLDVTQTLNSVDALTDHLRAGDIILTRVAEVAERRLTLTVWPGHDVNLDASQVTGNPLDDIRDLATPGETLPARVVAFPPTDSSEGSVHRDNPREWQLSLLDVDPEDPPTRPTPPLLAGGPGWLSGPPTLMSPAAEMANAEPHPALGPGGLIVSDRSPATGPPLEGAPRGDESRFWDLEAELREQLDVIREQQQQIARLRAANERLRTANRRGRIRGNTPKTPEQPTHGFRDPEEQLRWEIYRTWVEQTHPGDKGDHPLPEEWHIGPEFMDSLNLAGVSKARVLSVVTHVLTGRGLRDTHPLRSGLGGNSPQASRADGALAWRTPLQQNSPSARRLHWWRRTDGTIELARIVLHDDFAP